jgi:nucleoside-diphosphate-sugar epimerase
MKAIVTGAAGFLGANLCEELIARGFSVSGIDNLSPSYDVAQKEMNIKRLQRLSKFKFFKSDLLDLDLKAVFKGAHYVFHMAGESSIVESWKDPQKYVLNNVLLTAKVLEAAKSAKLLKMIFASSSYVYGAKKGSCKESDKPHPISPFAVTKHVAEGLCQMYHKEAKVPVTIVRYFTIYGPRQRPEMLMSKLLKVAQEGGEFELYGNDKQTRDFTYISDAVNGTILAAEKGKPSSVYNIANGTKTSIKEVISIIEDVTKGLVDIRKVKAKDEDVQDNLADISKAKRELGYHPNVTMAEGLARQIYALERKPL